jgi:hypothetical protein
VRFAGVISGCGRGYAGAFMRMRLTLAAAAAALLSSAAPAFAGDPIMPLSEVRSGMHCTGYSVVRGTDITSFDVDVIDVVDGDPSLSGPRILIEASGAAVDRTGIGPGFSGSPIYCRGGDGVDRNIGAISESIGEYGGKVVLATPIESILANSPDAPRERGAGAKPSRRASAASRRLKRLRAKGEIRPLTGPLVVSGLSRGLARAFEAAGKRAGRPVLATPAGPVGSFPVQTLRPGSAVSVGYSGGDLRLTAIGTVAYTDANDVWAFGHPFEGSGARSLLLQDAYVFRVINDPNTSGESGGSYKFAAPGHDIGTLSNDAMDAVVGRVGALPPVIPIRVSATDLDTGAKQVLHVTAADETDAGNTTGFSPVSSVAPLSIAQAGSSVLKSSPGRLSGRMCLTIRFRESSRSARFCNRYVSSSSADAADFAGGNAVALGGALDALDALGFVDGYTGRPPHITAVRATMELRRGERIADMRSVRVPRTVRPGQKIRARIALRRLHGPRIVRRYSLRIPRDVRPGRRKLVLTSGGGSNDEEQFFEEILGGSGTDGGPTSLRELIDMIRGLGRFDGITGRMGGERFSAFKDADLLLSGRVSTTVRVQKRR